MFDEYLTVSHLIVAVVAVFLQYKFKVYEYLKGKLS